MATISHRIELDQDGQLAIPDDITQELGLKPGDQVDVSLDEEGIVHMRRAGFTFEELIGSLPPLNRHVDDDFGNVIRESQDEWVEMKMKRYGLK